MMEPSSSTAPSVMRLLSGDDRHDRAALRDAGHSREQEDCSLQAVEEGAGSSKEEVSCDTTADLTWAECHRSNISAWSAVQLWPHGKHHTTRGLLLQNLPPLVLHNMGTGSSAWRHVHLYSDATSVALLHTYNNLNQQKLVTGWTRHCPCGSLAAYVSTDVMNRSSPPPKKGGKRQPTGFACVAWLLTDLHCRF